MKRRLMLLTLPVFSLFTGASCDDNPPTSAGNTTTTTAPATSGGAFLRGGQFNEDARTVDLMVNGQIVAASITYGGVGPYVELAPGDYRAQFFPTGDTRHTLVETQLALGANQSISVNIVGLGNFETFVVSDDRSTRSDRARLKFVNTVPDYPSTFDLVISSGPGLFQDVGYLQSKGTAELIPGVYDFEIHRVGTAEVVATVEGALLSAGANHSVYALGAFRRDDIELTVTRDAP